ncbi:dTDP-4-dehydrorhamnose reductase [Lysobacter brunescens]|uniref:dTDP-4-dehydrorhamnose reductase n=1 Tax=Lysobacter brunescens TaxID=262323 RepID=A0ABW2YC84_9GAMM
MRILLFGANGQVGHELRRSLARQGEIVATTRSGRLEDGSACEIADFDAPEALPALVERIAPSLVVNAAAYTAVDKAESDRDAAFRANAEAPSRIAEACARRGIPLVHYSTDYVFDGTGTRPYREDDPTAPLGVYGESKLAGEQGIRASGASHMILRTAWVYAPHGKNFLRTMLRLGAERDTLGVVADQIGTPTSAGLIADVTAEVTARLLSQTGTPSGTWHLTASDETSWHGFAEAIFAGAVVRGLLPRAPQVNAIATADYPTPARRPAYSRLDTSRLQVDFGVELPDWREVCDLVLDGIARSSTP